MKRRHLVGLVLVLFLPGAFSGASPQAGARGTIQGVVLRGTTDEPVANARVARSGSRADTITDRDGRFIFENLEPGDYRMRISNNGYVEQVFPSRETGVKLAAGQILNNLTVRLTPTGTVTGRLISRTGQPLGDVPVRLLDATNREFVTFTNDRGEYRFFFVTPGLYRLSAGGATAVRSNGAARRFAEEFEVIYYPGVVDQSLARSFNVNPGEELSSMDMVMGDPRAPTPLANRSPENGPL